MLWRLLASLPSLFPSIPTGLEVQSPGPVTGPHKWVDMAVFSTRAGRGQLARKVDQVTVQWSAEPGKGEERRGARQPEGAHRGCQRERS